MHGGTGLNDIFHKGDDLAFRVIANAAQPNAPKSFGFEHLYCDDHKGFGCAGFTPFRVGWLGLVTDGNESFIDLYQPIEHISARANHGATKAMQHGPGSLITPKTQHAL